METNIGDTSGGKKKKKRNKKAEDEAEVEEIQEEPVEDLPNIQVDSGSEDEVKVEEDDQEQEEKEEDDEEADQPERDDEEEDDDDEDGPPKPGSATDKKKDKKKRPESSKKTEKKKSKKGDYKSTYRVVEVKEDGRFPARDAGELCDICGNFKGAFHCRNCNMLICVTCVQSENSCQCGVAQLNSSVTADLFPVIVDTMRTDSGGIISKSLRDDRAFGNSSTLQEQFRHAQNENLLAPENFAAPSEREVSKKQYRLEMNGTEMVNITSKEFPLQKNL